MKKIGIFAGTFDLVHKGHVAFAQAALDYIGLDTVLFIPEKSQLHKAQVSPLASRVKCLDTAIANIKGMELFDAPISPITFRNLIPALELTYQDAQYFLLVGSDVALSLTSWDDINELANSWQIVVGLRNNTSAKTVKYTLEKINIDPIIVTTEHASVSSSQYKNRP